MRYRLLTLILLSSLLAFLIFGGWTWCTRPLG